MSDSGVAVKPYIPADRIVAETTFLSIGLGIILAVVMAAANVYLGLYAGLTVSASIPAAVISMAILRGVFRRGTILENNISQTIASSGESLAAGAIFTIPALILVGAWQDFEFWPTTFIVMTGGLLGVVFMIPLRRALIVERTDLTYPEGVACAEVLIVGQEGGAGIKWIGIGLGIGAIFKYLVSGFALIRGTVEGAVAAGKSVFYAGSDMSVAMLGVGYIVNLSVAAQVFAGGAIGWLIAIPILGGYTEGPAVEYAAGLWSSQVRFIGVGAMLVGGVWSIWSVRKGIRDGIASLRGVSTRGREEALRTERNMAFSAMFTIFIVTTIGTFVLYDYLTESLFVALVAGTMMIFASFLFVAVATYIVGLVGSSNSPVSGMTICALLLTAGVLLALGIRGDSAILATLGVAGVVCCAACTAGDIAQDLKTGQLVGATPSKQQWCEVIGVIAPVFVLAPVMSYLHKAYVIGEGLRAPQATLFASLTDGFFGDGTIPWTMVGIGAGIGVAIIAADLYLRSQSSKFRLHIMPVAVGIYLPVSVAVPIFLGGLLRHFTTGRSETDAVSEAQDKGVLFGSGLIAGEALMGIGLAVPISLQWVFFTYEGMAGSAPHWVISLVLFAGVIGAFRWVARRA